jgi:hypothetical protein
MNVFSKRLPIYKYYMAVVLLPKRMPARESSAGGFQWQLKDDKPELK